MSFSRRESLLASVALLALTLAMVVGVSAAHADEPSSGTLAAASDAITAQADGDITSGTWGTCPWEISADGTLTVHPGTGADFAYNDEEQAGVSPWYAYRESVNKVVCVNNGDEKVIAPTDSSFLFANLGKVTSFDFSGLDMSHVEKAQGMFSSCTLVTELDLSSFDTSGITDMSSMFSYCASLETIVVDDSWNVDNASSSWAVFDECFALVGGRGTEYNHFYTGIDYARIDAEGAPGYLTSKDDMSKTSIAGAIVDGVPNQAYTGEEVTPGLKVTLNNAELVPGQDYTVVYSDNVNSGTAKAKVVGTGGYRGVVRATFSIDPPEGLRGAGKWGTCPWELSESGTLTVRPGVGGDSSIWVEGGFTLEDADGNGSGTTYDVSPWYVYRGDIKSIAFTKAGTNMVEAPSYCNQLFAGLTEVTSIDLSGLDVSSSATLEYLFYGCVSLASIQFSGFDTSGIWEMDGMFEGCRSLRSLDLSTLDTSNVQRMSYMFKGCRSLESLDLSTFDTQNLEDVTGMFSDCVSLSNLNLTSLSTSNVTWTEEMFRGCSSLTEIDLTGLGTFNLRVLDRMFDGCSTLHTIYASDRWSTASVEWDASDGSWRYDNVFSGCTNLVGGNGTTYDAQNVDAHYARIDAEGFPGYFTQRSYSQKTSITDATLSEVSPQLYTGEAIEPSLTVTVNNNELTAGRDYRIRYVDNVECGTATAIVTGMGDYCGVARTTFRIGETESEIYGTWGTCPWEISADGTLTVHPGEGGAASKEVIIDHSIFNVSYWCDYRADIKKIVFAEEGNAKVVAPASSAGLLSSLENVVSIDFSGLDTSNVTNMSWMFQYCSSLQSFDLSGFDTSSVKYMNSMFQYCSSLQSLDLSGFDTSGVMNMSYMFDDCGKLEKIVVGDAWSTSAVAASIFMFDGCKSLVGGNGTEYDSAHVDAEYARVDDSGLPGYLTYKGAHPKVSLSGAAVILSQAEYAWDGTAKEPAVTVKLGNDVVPASGYDVSYSGNVGPGTATVTVTGKGGYTGTAKATFKISRKHTVAFSSEGRTLTSAAYDHGTPAASIAVPAAPSKAPDATSTYVFAGWEPALSDVIADVTYAARFTAVPKADSKADGDTGVEAAGGVFDSKPAGVQSLELVVDEVEGAAEVASATGAYKRQIGTGSVAGVFEVDLVQHRADGTTAKMTERVGALKLTFPVDAPDGTPAKVIQLHEAAGGAPVVIEHDGLAVSGRKVAVTLDGRLSTFIVTTQAAEPGPGGGSDGGAGGASAGDGPGELSGDGRAPAAVASRAMHRLYNQWSGEHFYTADDGEFAGLVALGWTDEGTGWTAPETSSTPVFRLYNPYAGEHHYTMDAAERDAMVEAGWVYEDVGWYSDDAKAVPLYREYNPNEPANNHNYTTNKDEHDFLVSIGWVDEGYAWYGM